MRLSPVYLLAVGAAAQNVTFNISTTPPSSASGPVDKSFLGIMVETTSWWRYGLVATSLTLIQNIVDRTGAPVIIRVGGTSGDETMYNASQTTGNFWPYKNDGLLAPVTLGINFTNALTNVPGVRYILNVPLANSSVTNTVRFTQDVLKRMNVSQLEAIEVGNEPNLYDGQEWRGTLKRQPPYTPEDYVTELKKYTDAIVANVSGLPDGPIFHVGSVADSANTEWSTENLYKAGLGSITRVKAFAQHYYQSRIKDGPTLAGTYLDHNGSVLHKLNENPQESLDYFRSANISTPIVISEAGSATGSIDPYERAIEAVLGSALWEIDWALLAMSKGISRVNMNQCNGCNFAAFMADNDTNQPEVFSQYYGLMFLADWMGLEGNAGSGDFKAASIYDATKYPNVSSYAGFVGDKLDRIAVLDLTQWNSTETSARPENMYQVGVGEDVKIAALRRLTGNGTNAMTADGTIVYAGTQWTPDAPAGTSVGNETEEADIEDGGILSFKLKASEAVLITLFR